MYIGCTSSVGAITVAFEAIDNAIDQFLSKQATKVSVTVEDNRIVISDDGAGYPFDLYDENGDSLGTHYLTTLHNKNTADDHTPHIHCMTIGVGLFCLNAVTERLTVSSWRNGSLWRQDFSRGVALNAADVVQSGTGRGTTVDFILDTQIFQGLGSNLRGLRLDLDRLAEQLKLRAYIFPGLKILFQGNEYMYRDGMADLIRERIAQPISRSRIAVSDAWMDRPVFYMRYDCNDFQMQAAAFGETVDKTEWLAFANGACSLEEGTHCMAFKQALARRVHWRPSIAAISVVMNNPEFSGPTKTRLDIPSMKNAFVEAISPNLKEYCLKNRLGMYRNERTQRSTDA